MSRLRPSDRLLIALTALAAAWVVAGAEAAGSRVALSREVEVRAALVRRLGLTDLALFTEAPYTRHPALADRFSPFQDGPGAREKFPSGALLAPPRHPPRGGGAP